MLKIQHMFAVLTFLVLGILEAIQLFVVKGNKAKPLFRCYLGSSRVLSDFGIRVEGCGVWMFVEDDYSWWTTLNDYQGKVRTRLG